MAKKKIKKVQKKPAKKSVKKPVKKIKKVKIKKRVRGLVQKSKKAKKIVARKKIVAEKIKAKVLGKIDHYFDRISVAAMRVLSPFKVGDFVHVKGHTTDFFQKIESMQIERQSVEQAKRGDDVGLKIVDFVRPHDLVYLATEEEAKAFKPPVPAIIAKPISISKPVSVSRSMEEPKPFTPSKPLYQMSIFIKEDKPIVPFAKPAPKPNPLPAPSGSPPPQSKPDPKKKDKPDPYAGTMFLKF